MAYRGRGRGRGYRGGGGGHGYAKQEPFICFPVFGFAIVQLDFDSRKGKSVMCLT